MAPALTRGDEVEHTAGQPALLEDLGEGEHRKRCLLGGLDDHRAARGDRRSDLAGAHRQREVPRSDQQARTDRLTHRQQPAAAIGRGGVTSVDPHRLLGEPPQELGGIDNLRTGFRQWLTHLQRHQQRQIIGSRDDHLEGTAQDLTALARRMRRPGRRRVYGRIERRDRVGGGGICHFSQNISGGRILNRKGSMLTHLRFSADKEFMWYRFDNPMFVTSGDRAHS